MSKPLPPIHETLAELEAQLKRSRDPQRRPRLHLLVLLGSGAVKSRQEAASHLAVHRNTVGRWLSAYEQGGLAALLHLGAPGAPAEQKSLPAPVLSALQQRLQTDGFEGYTEVQRWLADEYALAVPYTTVHSLVRYRLGAKLKRARPVHAKETMRGPVPSPRG